jgi:hypothetical protein
MTIARMYVVPLNIAPTTDSTQDIWELINGSTKICVLHGFSLTTALTAAAVIRLELLRRSTTGAGGSAATEVALDEGNTIAATAAVNTLVTTQGTPGNVLKSWNWSQTGELLYLPTPELRPVVSASGRLALSLNTALAGTGDWEGWVAWEEL